jgi:hypothetical protein
MADAPLPLDGETAVRTDPLTTPSLSRFAPGTVIADRYRIVAQLGRGGMGEVYRAEDMKLGHAVALKFLPRELAHDRGRLDRLIAEVRIGRQVSHPNVCRLYDIVEWKGTHFIAMEYVDGEDLASLLRRIGRLPVDKALDIARDLAAGLAAAHDLGVIHRDLKPANVMIDGRGKARITDFGLATLVDDGAARGFAGTPAYMAPEQLRGEAATPRSDLYALGVVLFEMFTGRRLFEGATLEEIVAKRASAKTPSVSSVVREIDPAVERVIGRCLEDDPSARPPSARAVIASLPGGDPLAAALAAGETPSPEMVAAAGAVGDLRPAVAWSAFAVVVTGLVALALMADHTQLFRLVSLPKSTEVLQARAQEIAEHLGYTTPIADIGGEWIENDSYTKYMTARDQSANRWRAIARARPGVVGYMARLSPQPMHPWQDEWRIASDDPPLVWPGMMRILIDPQGRLLQFFAVPPDKVDAPAAVPTDWSVLFRESGIDPARFHPTRPRWSMPVDSDAKFAWDGTLAEQPDVPMHIEAAARAGKPVAFALYGPWDEPRPFVVPRGTVEIVGQAAGVVLEISAYIIGIILAIHNLRRGRSDRKAAFRLAAFCFFVSFAAFLVRADRYSSSAQHEWEVSLIAAKALFKGAIVWLLYIALEPHVRRKWPRTLISWSRMLAGRFRDPMVGRDVLIGVVAGLAPIAMEHLVRVALPWFGAPAPPPIQEGTSPFASPRHAVFLILNALTQFGIFQGIGLLAALVLLRVVLRSQRLAVAMMFVLLWAAFLNGHDPHVIAVPFAAMTAGLFVYVIVRHGLLPLTVCGFVWFEMWVLPPTLDTSAWYFGRFFLGSAIVISLALYGLIVSLGNKPLLGTPLFDET